MKHIVTILFCILFVLPVIAQNEAAQKGEPDPSKKILIVETACGECRLGLHGKSCDLAVRINGKAYIADGIHIDSFGDAHAKDGFCEAVRKAETQGTIVGDRFKVTYFKLLPSAKKSAGKPAAFKSKSFLTACFVFN